MRGRCRACGTQWDTDEFRAAVTSYFFSSASHAVGTYTTATAILTSGEEILTCPLDGTLDRTQLGYAHDTFTPSGPTMATGADRYTEGDEPGDVPPLPYPDTVVHEP